MILAAICINRYQKLQRSIPKLGKEIDNVTSINFQKRKLLSVPLHVKRNVSRDSFTIGNILGSGNFGNVFKGEIKGLYEQNDKFIVAIKSINDSTNETEVNWFLDEIKIMSNIDPHLNLVNMIGSCTSEYETSQNIWLLIEFCNHGDMKNYLIEHFESILSPNHEDTRDSRILIQWSYDIAQGMKFLSKSQIMHGDLAARNVLISENPVKSCRLIAKVADFGLSKDFKELYKVKYTKESRVMIPWKWMAIEYLRDDYFTLTSDVWSFAVVIWEILSFGKMPYGPQGYEEVMQLFDKGYRLQCPNEAKQITTWSVEQFYMNISEKCFIKDPNERSTFTEVVKIIEHELFEEEIQEYKVFQEKHETIHRSNYISNKSSQT